MSVLKAAAHFALCYGATLINTFHCSMPKEQSFYPFKKALGLQIMLLHLFGFIFNVLIELFFFRTY